MLRLQYALISGKSLLGGLSDGKAGWWGGGEAHGMWIKVIATSPRARRGRRVGSARPRRGRHGIRARSRFLQLLQLLSFHANDV